MIIIITIITFYLLLNTPVVDFDVSVAQVSVADPDSGGRSVMESLLGTYAGRSFDSLPWIDPDLQANSAEQKGFLRKKVATATSMHSWTLISFCFSAICLMVVTSRLLQ